MSALRPGIILQHAATGPAGRLAAWCAARGHPFVVHPSWERSPARLDPAEFAWAASLGSAHSASAEDPGWIPEEVRFLRDCVAAATPVLGLCWGGQALALALGSSVGPAPFSEKGWLAVDSHDPGIPAGPWLHYHGEIFEVPAGASELARSPAGPAAFRSGPHLGLQFHPEADLVVARGWAAKDPAQTAAGRAELEAEGRRLDPPVDALAFALFDDWWERLG